MAELNDEGGHTEVVVSTRMHGCAWIVLLAALAIPIALVWMAARSAWSGETNEERVNIMSPDGLYRCRVVQHWFNGRAQVESIITLEQPSGNGKDWTQIDRQVISHDSMRPSYHSVDWDYRAPRTRGVTVYGGMGSTGTVLWQQDLDPTPSTTRIAD